MLACVYRLNLHLEAVGALFFSCLFFNFLIQYRFLLCFALITPQSLNSFFDVILPVILHWYSLRPNRNVDFVVSFFFHVLYFFLNECNCCTSSIVHFHCLAISYVCQICGPFCQRYLMIVHVRLYGLCQRSCVKFKKENVVFCTLYHLNVYILVLQFAQRWPFDQPVLWKWPRNSARLWKNVSGGKRWKKNLA